MQVPQIPKPPPPPPSKLATRIHRFRVFASKHSTTLIYVWCGVMILGMGKLHYDINIQKKRLGFTKEEVQPDPKMEATIRKWFEKLGLDKIVERRK